MHAVALRNRGQSFAGSAALDRFGSLVVAQFALAAEFDAGSHRALAAFARAFANKLQLELSDGGQERRQRRIAAVADSATYSVRDR